jgi:predicted metal-dependent phosphoesterase TrpH
MLRPYKPHTMTDAPQLIRVDCHNHTYYSPDSILSPGTMLRRAKARGLNVIAVTDHNTVRGGLVAQELAAKRFPELRVIAGEEVRTADGEVLGLFLSQDIPRDLSAIETIECIHAQGGVAGAPHPFDPLRSGLRAEGLALIEGQLEFIEGLNARMVNAAHNEQAQKYAKAHGLPLSAASDAHSPREIARCYVEMPDFETPAQFLESLRAGKLRGRLSSPLIHLISRYAMLRRALGWRPPA